MLQEQADKMNFETKMRSFVRELIDPIMTKGKVDREMIFRLDKQREQAEERIDILEQAVYRKDSITGQPTLFEQQEAKMLKIQCELKTRTQDIENLMKNINEKLSQDIFNAEQRVS